MARIIERDRLLCGECGSTAIVYSPESGEQICSNCGLVIKERTMDRGPEWRAFTPEEVHDRSRVGSPVSILQADKGLPTVINDVNRDAFGRRLPRETRMKMLMLKRLQSQHRSPLERNLSFALSELDRITDTLHMSNNIKKEAAEIYRRALDKDLIRGRKIAAIVAASVYAACRKMSTPRPLKEIAAVCRVDMKSLTRSYRLILTELPITMPIPDPKLFVGKIASKIQASEKVQVKAIDVIREAEKHKALVGKDPMGLAASAIYLATNVLGEKITQRQIAAASGVCELTVRNRYKGLRKTLGFTA